MVCHEVLSKMNISALRAFGLGLVLAAPSIVFAQETPPPPPPPAAPAGAHHWGHGPMAEAGWSPAGRHLKAIHDILGIKPDQEAAFQAYAGALRPPPPMPGPGDQASPDHKAMAALTTPERLDLMAKRMDAREARMHERFARMAEATKTFYAILTPEQKRIMDSLPELDHGEGHGWGHAGGMGHMHDGPGPMGPPPPGAGD